MAENGRVETFRDRRGQNPFQPVKVASPRVRSDHARPERMVESYNGQGSNTPNGSALPRYINGVQISRESPDSKKRYDTELRLGIRRQGEA